MRFNYSNRICIFFGMFCAFPVASQSLWHLSLMCRSEPEACQAQRQSNQIRSWTVKWPTLSEAFASTDRRGGSGAVRVHHFLGWIISIYNIQLEFIRTICIISTLCEINWLLVFEIFAVLPFRRCQAFLVARGVRVSYGLWPRHRNNGEKWRNVIKCTVDLPGVANLDK